MPEGDTVWRTARRLHEALAGTPISVWDLRRGEGSTSDLRGATTLEVIARGKHLLQRFDNGYTLHSHLRMEGQWRLERTLERPPPRSHSVQAIVGSARWTALGVRLGVLDLLPTAQEATVVGHLGPDVLGPDWDAARVIRNLTAYDGFIGDALLDQRQLAGVGTFWASEALFAERVLPWSKTTDLATEQIAAIVERVHSLMDRGKGQALQSSTGILRIGAESWVHGRSGRPCRRCGDTVRVAMTGAVPRQRTLFSCPTCQGGRAPSDDGEPQRPLGSGRRGRP